MAKSRRQRVLDRAGDCCEYCRLPQHGTTLPHQIDHIIAQEHDGPTEVENLALACFYCNSYKGPNIAGIDPDTGEMTRLLNPRVDDWSDHFEWDGASLVGKTPIGRTTIVVLEIDLPGRVEHRQLLMRQGVMTLDA